MQTPPRQVPFGIRTREPSCSEATVLSTAPPCRANHKKAKLIREHPPRQEPKETDIKEVHCEERDLGNGPVQRKTDTTMGIRFRVKPVLSFWMLKREI
ncbi:hypothetical protein SKAU_G00395680 [Synaphobranchus kaupii]|uniref:Uncharacterized protein n=1 Tax=Synaphobranchus kaupii TaxID=118154 RepID=A0A9Q1ID75_SYNKA|nr:hypothetical protein SKAU_G00395680 [Synaphobranchus kaupii]